MRADIEARRDTRQSDRLFHLRVAELTGNAVLSGLVDGLWAHMLAPMFDVLGRHAGLRGEDRMTIADHERIVEALGRGDPAARARRCGRIWRMSREILMREDLEEARDINRLERSRLKGSLFSFGHNKQRESQQEGG
jgi:DNA-binding FadR family transcriptional regulator